GKPKHNLRSFRLLRFIVSAYWGGRVSGTDSNLNSIQEILLVFAATVELDVNLIVIKGNGRHGYDFTGFDRLTVLSNIFVQLVLVDVAGIREFNTIFTKRQCYSGGGLLGNNTPKNVVFSVAGDLRGKRERNTKTNETDEKTAVTHARKFTTSAMKISSPR